MTIEEENTLLFNDASAVATTSDAQVCLHVYHRTGAKVVPLYPDTPLVIGRLPEADLSIPDKTLSREHARFELRDGEVWVQDLGSKNGTLVNGEAIDQQHVQAGDEVTVGAVKLLVQRQVAGATQQPLDTHDGLVQVLETEVLRARTFGRGLALIAVRSSAPSDDHVSAWCPQVQKLVRPIDRVAIYGPNVVEIFLPESPRGATRELAQKIVACRGPGEPRLLCGVAEYPMAAASAEQLVEVTHTALKAASQEDPVQFAQSRGTDVYSAVSVVSDDETGDEHIVYSPVMRELYAQAERVAQSDLPVLILGETGTGKEVLTRAIHRASPRVSKPLRCINCAAIPGQLLESLLFGHERGAFTGAVQRSKGVFEEATGGTVLLDEIGELSPEAQAALLRVLETKCVTRVGSNREIEVDVRIVAATHRNLEAMAEEGTFRWDLFYRLNTITFRMPPLRDRPEEIVPLAKSFAAHASTANDLPVRQIDRGAIKLLTKYRWPGNIRELRNVIERAVVVAQGEMITVVDLSDRVREAESKREREAERTYDADSVTSVFDVAEVRAAGVDMSEPFKDFKSAIQGFEKELILAALAQTGGNKTAAARRLDIPLRTMLHKITNYEITEEQARVYGEASGDTILRAGNGAPFWARVQGEEMKLIRGALARTKGNKAAAARQLKMPIRTLVHKLNNCREEG